MRVPSNSPSTVSRRTAMVGMGAGGLGLALTARGAGAQDDTANLAGHPIVGVWSSVTGPQTPPGLRAIIAFHGDGTLTSLNSFGGTGVGVWQGNAEHSIQGVITFYNTAQVPGEYVQGTVTVAGSFTVDEAGTMVTEESTVDIRGADDTAVANFPNTATFTRMSADAPPASGTPEATPAA